MQHDMLAPWAERAPDALERMTARELLARREDGWRYELVEGRLVRMPPIGGGHGWASGKLYAALDAYVVQHTLGMVTDGEHGFVLSQAGQPDTVLAADVHSHGPSMCRTGRARSSASTGGRRRIWWWRWRHRANTDPRWRRKRVCG